MRKRLCFSIGLIVLFLGCEEAGDTTAPEISIVAPVNGASVEDTIVVRTVVTDNEGVTRVTLLVDGVESGVDTTELFEFQWATRNVTNGNHSLVCKAEDGAGNESLSETITVTVENGLIAAFTSDWLCPECGEGVLFYSDMEGNLLWAGTWTGNETVQVIPDEGEPYFPERIMVSTVTRDPSSENLNLVTNIHVKPEDWTWKIDYAPSDYTGNLTLNFENMPDHSGYLVSTKWRYDRRSGGTLANPLSHALSSDDTGLYIMLNTIDQGPGYLWIEEVQPGQTLDIDLATLIPLTGQTVSFPGEAAFVNYGVRGFFEEYYNGYYRLNNQFYPTDNSDAQVYAPTDLFDEMRTYVYWDEEDYPTNNYWYSWVIDEDVPSSLTKLEADFGFVATTPDNFQLLISGTHNMTLSYWEASVDGWSISWNGYGALDAYTMPELPDLIEDVFGVSVQREDFTLSRAGIGLRTGYTDNDELIDIIFRSNEGYYNQITASQERYKDPNGLRPEGESRIPREHAKEQIGEQF